MTKMKQTATIFHCRAAGFEAARSCEQHDLHGHSFVLSALDTKPLATALNSLAQSLNYCHLNQHYDNCADMELLESMHAQLGKPRELRLQSAPNRGALISNGMNLHWHKGRFEAAHFLPHVPPGHKCGRLHGHGFELTLYATASSAALAQAFNSMHQLLDRQLLNDIVGLENPTSEVLAAYVWHKIELPNLYVHIKETDTAASIYDGKNYHIWKQQMAECAIESSDYKSVFGHSYNIRLHIASELDQLAGWLLDYGDIKQIFKPLYRQIDHHLLSNTLNKKQAQSIDLLQWISDNLATQLPQLTQLSLHNTPYSGLILDKLARKQQKNIPYLLSGW